MNLKSILRFPKSFAIIIGLMIIVCCFVFQGCERDDFKLNEVKYTDSQYELILKNQIDSLTKKTGKLNNSFINKHGLPLWSKAKWVETKSGKMFVVPLMNSSKNNKHLIGIIEDNNIVPVITEYSDFDPTLKKIYSVHNRIMYDSKIGVVPMVRLKSASTEGDEVSLNGLLTNDCGSAADLFDASNTGCNYNSNETFGTINICTGGTDGGSSASWSTAGHAWIEITTYSGERITFSLWSGASGHEYFVNREVNFPISSSMSTSISYGQFQNILDYNGNCSNLDWSPTNTCAGYSTGIWNAATGSSLGFGYITTPGELYNYIINNE